MRKNVPLTFACSIIIFLYYSITSCSYIKMTYYNEKDEILNKISPFARHDKPDEDYSNLAPRYTDDYDTLNDPVFNSKYGECGLFLPKKFMKQVRYNFYLLDKKTDGKIPVVFVHGAGGTPADWKYFLKNMNHDKFFPIVFYYPTGIRLNNSAELLYKGLKELFEYYGHTILIAHSMGGLVSRGAIRLVIQNKQKYYIPLYISLSTPYGGLKQAREGIEHLPESAIVPSWKDIATKSKYIKMLYDPPIPDETDFRLFFGYKNPKKFCIGPNSDGTITIKSQLDFRAQKEASRLYGFDENHETILKKYEVVSILYELLEKTYYSVNSLTAVSSL